MPRPTCPHLVKARNHAQFFNVIGCEEARKRNPSENPEGKCDHWIYAPYPHEMDNPNMSKELLHGESVNGAVNCYPGAPGSCHLECYIFIDWVSDPWKCLERQIQSCPKTQHIYLIGSWDRLSHHQLRGRKVKHWLKGVGLLRPHLVTVQAREAAIYRSGRLENLYP